MSTARGTLARVDRCPRCGAWRYARVCGTPHDREVRPRE